jgi:hypothetical protein
MTGMQRTLILATLASAAISLVTLYLGYSVGGLFFTLTVLLAWIMAFITVLK